MAFEKVKEYFEIKGLGERVTEWEETAATVEQAAEIIGCEPAHIAKTMAFLVNNEPILIVAAGDTKIDNGKYKLQFGQKAVMISAHRVEELVGHVPGGVCPFAVRERVSVYLDVSLKRFDIVHTAGGSVNSTIKLSVPELEALSNPLGWVDVCKGWITHEA